MAILNINSIFSEVKVHEMGNNIETKRKLKSAITLSQNKIENSIPKIKTISEGIAISDTYIKNITINEITYNHGFSGDCVVTFNKKESTATKVIDEQLYFNLKDLGKNMVKFYTEGKNVKIELQTKAGNKFVKHAVNQELKSYTNKFEMDFAEVEDALVSEQVLERLIKLCENTETKLVGSKSELLLQLKNNIKKVDVNKTAYEQSLELKDDNIIQFKNTEITEKACKTWICEFNLNDINSATVEINTSSTNAFVTVTTDYLE